MDLKLKIKTEKDKSDDFTQESLSSLKIEIYDPIVFVLNEDYVKFLSALKDHVTLIQIVQKNIHLRPSEPPKEKPKAWWIYAIKAASEERKRLELMIKSSTKNILNRKIYIDLYKRK
jgi:hypothetical protein